jgi:hypothetical protein
VDDTQVIAIDENICTGSAGMKMDEVELLAIWLYGSASHAGRADLVRGLIRYAMEQAVEIYELPTMDEDDDPQAIPTIISKFAASWDEFDREMRADEAG